MKKEGSFTYTFSDDDLKVILRLLKQEITRCINYIPSAWLPREEESRSDFIHKLLDILVVYESRFPRSEGEDRVLGG